jgi:hypothetical protein
MFAGMIHDKPIGRSTYHGLQIDLNKRFANSFSFKTGYTWSRSMDLRTGQGESYLPWNTQLDKGRTEFDVRHRLVLSSIADLPFGSGKPIGGSVTGFAGKLLSGWQVVAIGSMQSGFPLTLVASIFQTLRRVSGEARAPIV